MTASSNVAWLVIGLPAGVIAQIMPLRATQITMDGVRAVAMGAVGAMWFFGVLEVWHLVALGLVVSIADVVFDVANSTFLPDIVGDDELQNRNSLISGTDAFTSMAGPSLGGAIVSFAGPGAAFVADAVSYVVSGVTLRTLPNSRPTDRPTWPPVRAMIAEGWQYVVRHPVIGSGMWAATGVNFVCGVQLAVVALYLLRELHVPVGAVGVLIAADGIGSLAGAALMPKIARRFGTARATLGGALLILVGGLIIPIGTAAVGITAFVLGSCAFSFGAVVISVTARTYRQVVVPRELLPRVMATVRFVSWGALPLGSLAAGVAAEMAGARATLVVSVLVLVLVLGVLMASPIRRLHDLEDYAGSAQSCPDAP